MASGSEILEKQVGDLKRELKQWEKAFAATNGGRKPGRDDIRNDAFVSAKYREYDRLRRPIDKPKQAETTPKRQRQLRSGSHHKRPALRERLGNEASTTPNRAWKSTTTLDVVEEEEQEVEPTPAFIRCALGPTPQKDGQVLGIFDMALSATPSKASLSTAEAEVPVISGTPSKSSTAPATNAVSATPQSSSKRRFLDAFAGTPLKRKRSDDGQPLSSAKRQFATPAFLRRRFSLAPVEEESVAGAPPFRKRGLVRSLSSLIQGLRKQEESRMEDEWDIMNELEAEERGEEAPRAAQAPMVLVDDSQGIEMPLGPDQGPEESEDDGKDDPGALGADGQPRKVWKKKGLKRQTKRTNMRPVLHKPKKAKDLEGGDDDAVVGETQLAPPVVAAGETGADEEGAEGSDYHEDGEEDDAGATGKKQKKPKPSKAQDKEKSPPKKAPKKVNAQAHANFRKLKIKNKNSKANGRGGRFGRR